MSKKDIIKKYSNREFLKNGQLYDVGKWIKRYLLKRTTKRKYPIDANQD